MNWYCDLQVHEEEDNGVETGGASRGWWETNVGAEIPTPAARGHTGIEEECRWLRLDFSAWERFEN